MRKKLLNTEKKQQYTNLQAENYKKKSCKFTKKKQELNKEVEHFEKKSRTFIKKTKLLKIIKSYNYNKSSKLTKLNNL